MHLTAELESSGRAPALGRYARNVFNVALRVTDNTSKRSWIVMKVQGSVTVMDFKTYTDKSVMDATWSWCGNYAWHADRGYLHHLVMARPRERPFETVDHINWIYADNREENLRLATQGEQNANRSRRSDKKPPHPDLLAAGILYLPGGMRKDETMARYTCGDHPVCKESGKNVNGTRSSGSGELERFLDCLYLLIQHLKACPTYVAVAALAEKRRALVEEYNAIVRCAHEFDPDTFPDGPYACVEDHVDDLTYALQLARMLESRGVHVVRGGQTKTIDHLAEPGGLRNAMARIKDGVATLYDASLHPQLQHVNWEVPVAKKRSSDEADADGEGAASSSTAKRSGPVVILTKTITAAFPRCDGMGRKMPLKDFVWIVLANRALPAGHSVVPINGEMYDVRLDNLTVTPGEPFRSPVSVNVPDGVDIGMRFLPKGVSVSGSKVVMGKATGVVPTPPNLTVTKSRDLRATLLAAIDTIKQARGAEDFERSNAQYQRLLGEYIDARDAALSNADQD